MSFDEKLDSGLNLFRRLDPKYVKQNLDNVCTLVQNGSGDTDQLTLELLSSIDVPLESRKCSESGKEYLCCDYNRDGDSYRSPWSNKYYPPVTVEDDDAPPPYPSAILRDLEIKANESFDIYRDLYYEGSGVSSVYLWDTAEDEGEPTLLENGFAGVVLLSKETDDKLGKWDSIHVFEIIHETSSTATYNITTSVILDLASTASSLSLSGSLTRQVESSQSLSVEGGVNLETSHLINLGQLVEKAEYNIRNLLQEVYFDKLKDIIVKDLRSIGGRVDDTKQAELVKGLQGL